MVTKLVLRELQPGDEKAFVQSYENWKSEELDWYTFIWTPEMSHAEHLKTLADQKFQDRIPANRVPSTMLYGFVGEEIVGRFNIRHELNEYLRERGGHVGYAVSPMNRKKGYATEMFRQGVAYCLKTLGMKKLLVTCADQNTGSWKIIEHFGGQLENKLYDEKANEWIRRYWVVTDFKQS
jgi:predicted acetyltransferase